MMAIYDYLFPAYAGVILVYYEDGRKIFAFPRIRGGDPMFYLYVRR